MRALLVAIVASALTVDGDPGLARCAAIADSLERLRCYDALAGRSESAPEPAKEPSAKNGDPCEPEISREERLRRLATFGTVRQVGFGQYQAGDHELMFLRDGTLVHCK